MCKYFYTSIYEQLVIFWIRMYEWFVIIISTLNQKVRVFKVHERKENMKDKEILSLLDLCV